MTVLDRILAKIEPEPNTGCWLWVGACAISASGAPYPRMRLRTVYEYVYRVIYREVIGEIPDGCQIDHICTVTLCVRPSHLEAVTPQVNQHRSNGMGGRNARKETCSRGHFFDYFYQGGRRCSQCDAIRRRRAAALRRQEAATYADQEADVEISFP